MIARIAATAIGVLFLGAGVASGGPPVSPSRIAILIQTELKALAIRRGQSATDFICRAPSTGAAALTITSEYRCTYTSAGLKWTCEARPGAVALAGRAGPADVRTYFCTHPG